MFGRRFSQKCILSGLVTSLLFGAGCGIQMESEPAKVTTTQMFTASMDLEMISELRLTSNQLRVGEKAEAAQLVFQRPSDAYKFTDLPAGLEPPFQSFGWKNSREGFGILSYDAKVALIMQQYEKASEQQVNTLVEQLKQANAAYVPVMTEARDIRLWEWTAGKARLLIQVQPVGKDRFRVSITLGETQLSDFLGFRSASFPRTPPESVNAATNEPANL